MRAFHIEEPELEFGGGARHIDIRNGLAEHGPLDRGGESDPGHVRLGVVGAGPDVERFRAWVDACRQGVPAKESRRTTLFVEFPGFGEERPLCEFECSDRLVDTMSGRDLDRIGGLEQPQFKAAAAERYVEGAAHLMENAGASVVVCLLPETFVRRIDVPDRPDARARSRRRDRAEWEDVWHDLFKAKALSLNRPVQVVRPATYGGGVRGFTRDGKAMRDIQDEATRAWNFFVGLYYKANGVPWRLAREATDLMTCYVGMSFYRDTSSETLRTSVAQVFNERGEGMIVRGGPAQLDERDKSPHLTASDMEKLLLASLREYRREHRTVPARVVCHKSSYFNAQELEGAGRAVDQAQIDTVDLLSLRTSHTRLYRAGTYPPLRGTAVSHAGGCLLYTQGSVDFYRCYPGLYTPTTLDVRLDRVASGERQLVREILALTKMNWNSTELVNREPITLAATRGVGGILRHVPPGEVRQSRYAYFM